MSFETIREYYGIWRWKIERQSSNRLVKLWTRGSGQRRLDPQKRLGQRRFRDIQGLGAGVCDVACAHRETLLTVQHLDHALVDTLGRHGPRGRFSRRLQLAPGLVPPSRWSLSPCTGPATRLRAELSDVQVLARFVSSSCEMP